MGGGKATSSSWCPRRPCGSRDFVEGERACTPRGLSLDSHMGSSMPPGSVGSPVGRVQGGRRRGRIWVLYLVLRVSPRKNCTWE